MDNIQTYNKWRKDIPFKVKPFNDVDALIFAALAYIEWDFLAKKEMFLNEACKLFLDKLKEEDKKKYFFSYELPSMVKDLIDSDRYKEVKIKNFESILDKIEEVQFAAVTFVLKDGSEIVAYRGTDRHIIGWKEDFNMTYQKEVPAQRYALAYLVKYIEETKVKSKLSLRNVTNKDLYLVGHSKGGNLAMYSAIKALKHSDRIKKVYNFDGPGFNDNFYKQNNINNILPKIITILPKGAIFGRLLTHKEATKIVDAYDSGLLQHSSFRWKVDKDCFVEVEAYDEISNKTLVYVEKVFLSKSYATKKKIINAVFDAIDKLNVDDLSELGEINPKDILESIKELGMMSNEDRKFIFDCLIFMLSQAKSLIKLKK